MKILCAALLVSSAIAACAIATPASARHLRHHHHHVHRGDVSLGIDYAHNYGPGIAPNTFAYYDGPLSIRCDQSAAAYRGQDRRRHPCN